MQSLPLLKHAEDIQEIETERCHGISFYILIYRKMNNNISMIFSMLMPWNVFVSFQFSMGEFAVDLSR